MHIFPGKSLTAKLFVWILRHANAVIAQTERQKKLLKKNFRTESHVIANAHLVPEDAGISVHYRQSLFRIYGLLGHA